MKSSQRKKAIKIRHIPACCCTCFPVKNQRRSSWRMSPAWHTGHTGHTWDPGRSTIALKKMSTRRCGRRG